MPDPVQNHPMSVSIDNTSPIPPFEQVRVQLAQQINDGTLPVGSQLPTVRTLAADLGIAANTVARAYRELEAAALLETRGRAGTFVGSNGDASLAKASTAAAEYVAIVDALGVDRGAALAIVTAALRVGR